MFKEKIFSFLLFGLAFSPLYFSSPAEAQRQGQNAEELQSSMNFETQARSTNTKDSWNTAGETWMARAENVGIITSHQDWVKDTLNPANHDLSVAIMKRSVGCFVKAYELEGAHETPQSRARSDALRNLSQAYTTLIRIDPRNSDWHYLLGELHCSKGEYKQSVPDLNKAVALGGSGGSKASALLAHTKPYLAHQLAADHALWAHNEAVAKWNAAHYRPVVRRPVDLNDAAYREHVYQQGHPGAGPHDHY